MKKKRYFPGLGKKRVKHGRRKPEIHDEKAGFMYLCILCVSRIHKGENKNVSTQVFRGQSHGEKRTHKTFPLEIKCKQANDEMGESGKSGKAG